EKWPLFVLSLASSVVTWVVQSRGGSASSLETIPLGARFVNAAISIAVYLFKTVWPLNLAVFYPHPALVAETAHAGRGLAGLFALVLVAAISAGVLLRRKASPWLAVGWLWFLGTLVPVVGIVQVGRQALADRYTYVPLVGIFLAVVWSAVAVVDRRPQ